MFEQALLVHYFLILQLLGEPGSHCTNGEIKKQKGQQILNRGTQMFIFFVFTDKSSAERKTFSGHDPRIDPESFR